MARRMWQRGPDGQIVRAPSAPAEPQSTPETPPNAPSLRRAHLGLALRLGARDTYDHLGSILVISLTWTLSAGLGLVGGQLFLGLF